MISLSSSFEGKAAPESDCHYKIRFAKLNISILILYRSSAWGKYIEEKKILKNLSSMETTGVKQPVTKRREEIPSSEGTDDMK